MRRFPLIAAAAVLLASTAGRADGPTMLSNVRFTMSDGVKIAADVYLPPGGTTGGPYPCLVEHTPYRKELRASEGASFLPGQGFALIEVDARGTGGSEGEYSTVFSLREQRDVAEIIEQLADPGEGVPGYGNLCTDRVGMYGGSYSGIIQYLVASLPSQWYPKHLAVIAPQRAYGDLYRDIVYHGGIAIGSFGQIWSAGTQGYYTVPPEDTNPADAAEVASAWSDHLTRNQPIMKAYLPSPYIDARYGDDALYGDSSILPRIGNLHVPVLHLAGWFDAFTRGQLLTFQRALAQEDATRGPNYLIIGPWNHSNTHFIAPADASVSGPPDMDGGSLKSVLADWYRYWLVPGTPEPSWMSGPHAHYYDIGTGALLDTTGSWKTSDTWPPAVDHERLYLHTSTMSEVPPNAEEQGSDAYVYNPTAGTAELLSRWDNAASGSIPMPAWDQRTDEPKGLSYTATFDHDVTISGTLNLHLHASTLGVGDPANGDPKAWPGAAQLIPPYLDTDFVVKVSDVASDGTATLITEGYLRASHRALDSAGSEFAPNGDVTRALHYDDSAHIEPVTAGADTTYDIEIWPTTKTFKAGDGLRLDIYSADTPGHLTLVKPVVNSVLHSPAAQSWLEIPELS